MSDITPSSSFHESDLSRYLYAQEGIYTDVMQELHSGRKQTHWMWFIFPQLAGLGQSVTSRHYALRDLTEAEDYLHHPVLGRRLVECAQAVFAIQGRSVIEIFGSPDNKKLRSSMTLFSLVDGADPIFSKVLEKYFATERDVRTLELLANRQRE